MTDIILEQIMQALRLSPEMEALQRIQTAHRLNLIDLWNIAPGSRVLEVGCGQGDTTAALAAVVGENGFVHAIDPAPGDYGAPFTLAEARKVLVSSLLGSRIRMDFDCSVFDLPEDTPVFDCAVLCHCLWYFASHDELLAILKKLRPLCRRLCIAEWDIRAVSPGQEAHRRAALIQATCAAFVESGGNIRTLFSPDEIVSAVEKAGFAVGMTRQIDSPDLQDGSWEVWNAKGFCPPQIEKSDMPDKLKRLLTMELSQLDSLSGREPLPVFALTAE